ncbi:sulfite exporter TauE/SafE family protein [Agromyces aerolatus]|uniref:sulfite exporter TauE/SafE family protein n=1 Tax=Agromyces sp. LY-1074 TaxID=3074080 RepID=UPI002855F0B2|nr:MULTISPECIES: sulfite exporter TauE/SafE family protein [unclassified Agromyces]MDR5700938.1 sulfite exporter TauE/SafE family protein [Agromyces sp. LY-1074]MDR5707401.1 sulfite exporter TauE/SafE family protein [Agromyces sp. LY-1358]
MTAVVACIALTVVVGAVLQRSAGLGFAMILSPVAVGLLGPVSGVMLVNFLAIGSSLLIIPAVWRRIDWRRYLPIIVAAVPGVLAGTWLTTVLPHGWLEIVIGVTLAAGLLITAILPRAAEHGERPILRLVTGGAAGAMSATAGAGGPAIVIYATIAQWPFPTLAATIQPFFATVAAMAVVGKVVAQPDQWPSFDAVGWAVIAGSLLAGTLLAHAVSSRIPLRVARAAAYLIAWCGAGVAVLRGVLIVLGHL